MNELDQLYQQVILDHSRERHGAGALKDPDGRSHQVNPTYGYLLHSYPISSMR